MVMQTYIINNRSGKIVINIIRDQIANVIWVEERYQPIGAHRPLYNSMTRWSFSFFDLRILPDIHSSLRRHYHIASAMERLPLLSPTFSATIRAVGYVSRSDWAREHGIWRELEKRRILVLTTIRVNPREKVRAELTAHLLSLSVYYSPSSPFSAFYGNREDTWLVLVKPVLKG